LNQSNSQFFFTPNITTSSQGQKTKSGAFTVMIIIKVSLEQFTENSSCCPTGCLPRRSFGYLFRIAAGNSLEVPQKPGQGVEKTPGLVNALVNAHDQNASLPF